MRKLVCMGFGMRSGGQGGAAALRLVSVEGEGLEAVRERQAAADAGKE